MVDTRLKYCLFVIALILWQQSFAQHLTSSVTINSSHVYVGEPVEVTVSVFTSTWFTSGLDIPNIKVNNAFTVPFRTLSTTETRKGKTYAGVQFFYNVFPYSENDIEFPSLTIEVETPDDGDYKGVKRTVSTPARKIKVQAIPPGFKRNEWLVTPNLTTKDSWSGDLNTVKVGDVLVRNIHRDASLTVSELIPPIVWDSIAGVSYYPGRSVTQNNKTRTTFSAERTDVMRYLFLEEGDVVIPEITLMWWNASRKKVYKRTLKERTIIVLSNPNLGMAESIKDSLDTISAQVQLVGEAEEQTYLGLTLKELLKRIAYSTVLLLVLYKLFRWIFVTKDLLGKINKRRAIYRESEYHHFKLFLFNNKFKSKAETLNCFYNWLNKLNLKESTASYLSSTYGTTKLIDSIIQLEANISQGDFQSMEFDVSEIKAARQRYFETKEKSKRNILQNWINP